MKYVKGHFRRQTVAQKLTLGRRLRNQCIPMGAIVCYILIYPEKLFCRVKPYLLIQVLHIQDHKGDSGIFLCCIGQLCALFPCFPRCDWLCCAAPVLDTPALASCSVTHCKLHSQ